jgi:phage-related minor tail protein
MLSSDGFYWSSALLNCFDNDGGDPPDPTQDPSGDDMTPVDKAFTVDEVNRIVEERLAKDRKVRADKMRELEGKYEELLKNRNLSEQERDTLQQSLEDVRKQLRTKEQQLAHERKQLEEQFTQRLTESDKKAEVWENRYREETINRALQDAAVGQEAYNPRQIVTQLRPWTKLAEDVDKTGKPSGNFKVMIDFPEVDAQTGEPTVIQATPSEILKKMKEMSEYANLFKSGVVSGLGANSATGGLASGANGRVALRKLTPQQYRELREKNPELLGLRPRGRR